MALRYAFIAGVLLALGAVGACVSPIMPGALPQQTGGDGNPDLEQHTLAVAGENWAYSVYVPDTLDAGERVPVVIVLHGTGETGANDLIRNHWIDKADEVGFIALAPEAPLQIADQPADRLVNPQIWNAGQPYVTGARGAIDDIAFFDALLDALAGRDDVDVTRVYVAGHSNGGGMAYRIAAERAERVRAIAVVASPLWQSDPQPTQPVPTIFLVGTLDPIHPIAGGVQSVGWVQRTTAPIAEDLARWAVAIGCASDPRAFDVSVLGDGVTAPDRVNGFEYPCSGVTPAFAALYLDGHGHRWPGGGTPDWPELVIGPVNPPLHATDVIWAFFALHD
jgi:polyhydroxybutyrate depolymerase